MAILFLRLSDFRVRVTLIVRPMSRERGILGKKTRDKGKTAEYRLKLNTASPAAHCTSLWGAGRLNSLMEIASTGHFSAYLYFKGWLPSPALEAPDTGHQPCGRLLQICSRKGK